MTMIDHRRVIVDGGQTQFVVPLVVTGHHDHDGGTHIPLGVRAIARTYVHHGGEELYDHQQGDKYQHAAHHYVEGVAERVELVVQQADVEHLLEAHDVLLRSE